MFADRQGFTLIELLVVMSIIATLSGLMLTASMASRKTARDGRRKADLEQIRSALEMCFSKDNVYPAAIYANVTCVDTYLPNTPKDPLTKTNYIYQLSGATYKLCAGLEIGGVTGKCLGVTCRTGVVCNYEVANP